MYCRVACTQEASGCSGRFLTITSPELFSFVFEENMAPLEGKAYEELYDNHNRRRDITTRYSDYGEATHAPLKITAIYGYGGNPVLAHVAEEYRNPKISLKPVEPRAGIPIWHRINRPFAECLPQMEALGETYQPTAVRKETSAGSLHPAGRGNPLPTRMMKNHSNLWTM